MGYGLGSVIGTVYIVARDCVKRMYASQTSLQSEYLEIQVV